MLAHRAGARRRRTGGRGWPPAGASPKRLGGVGVVDAHELAEIAATIEPAPATARERHGFVIGWWEICGLEDITAEDSAEDRQRDFLVGGPYTLTVDTPFSMTYAVIGASGDTFASHGSPVGMGHRHRRFRRARHRPNRRGTASLPTDCDPPSTPGVGRFTGGGDTIDTASG